MTRKKPQASTARRMHRLLGAGSAVFIIFIVLSGLAINHSNDLGLDQRHVSQPFLLGWYGLEGPDQIRSFSTPGGWISFAGSQLYFNGGAISTLTDGVGVVANEDMLVVGGSDELLLLSPDGSLIERIPWSPVAEGPIESIGLSAAGNVAVKSNQQLWMADAQLLSWQKIEAFPAATEWSSPDPTPVTLQKAITQQYQGDGLSLERLLLDFHSGRIFGVVGVVVYDLLALTVCFLAVSGLIFWVRSRRNGKNNGNGK